MTEWFKKNGLSIAIIVLSWAFTIGWVKANTETRLDRIERDVASLQDVSRRLELNVIKLETIVVRLERMVENVQ